MHYHYAFKKKRIFGIFGRGESKLGNMLPILACEKFGPKF